jgi:hypothetical protein
MRLIFYFLYIVRMIGTHFGTVQVPYVLGTFNFKTLR